MARISKDPEKRREELIDAAKRLFITKGYARTAVNDIVKEVNVAQGTFYYHFKSKTEILEEVVKKSILSLVERVRLAADKRDTSAVSKLNEFQDALIRFGNQNSELFDFVHQKSNLVLHDRLAKMTVAKVAPLLSKIIQDGVSEGVFAVNYPVETAKFILLAVGPMFHDPDMITDPEKVEKARITVEQCMARILGIKEGSFRMNL